MSDVTRILCAIENGDPSAAEQLIPLVYDELRKLAARKIACEQPGQTLQATSLVHEAYIRLVDTHDAQHWDSRGHFFAAAAEGMRRILVDRARNKKRLKRGGDYRRVALDPEVIAVDSSPVDLVALDDALQKLESVDQLSATIVKLRYFGGFTAEQTAQALGIARRTADRHWAFARAWLYKEIKGQ